MFDLTGKRALITGASGGIGGEIARVLHGQGATVALSGTRVEPLAELADSPGWYAAHAGQTLLQTFLGFALAVALGRIGDGLWRRCGREPSSNAFNSVVDLELEGGKPRNPFVNAGAIVVTDAILAGRTPKEALAEMLGFVRAAAGDDDIYMDAGLARSENLTGHRNWSLAHFLKSTDTLLHDCELTLGTYFHQCAIEMSCEQLARAGRFLAGLRAEDDLISRRNVRSINALMMTCGHYDGSGAFAYRVGLPGKSGVGGGIMAVVPGVASIAVWSPGLDRYGNSLLGTQALEALSEGMGWSVFNVG